MGFVFEQVTCFCQLICSIGSKVCFLLGLGAEMTPGSVAGCAEKNRNAMAFVRFHFFKFFCELDDIQSTFGCLSGSFLGTLASLFLIFEGLASRSENW